jgi:membrane-associated protein
VAVIVARFVPVVRTFTPIAAGVGHMNYRKYSLFNAVGALIWGAGLTFAGFLVAFVPPLRDFIVEYIDLILIFAVLCAIVPTGFHYIQSTLKARKARRLGLDEPLTDSEAIADVFEEGQTGKPKA